MKQPHDMYGFLTETLIPDTAHFDPEFFRERVEQVQAALMQSDIDWGIVHLTTLPEIEFLDEDGMEMTLDRVWVYPVLKVCKEGAAMLMWTDKHSGAEVFVECNLPPLHYGSKVQYLIRTLKTQRDSWDVVCWHMTSGMAYVRTETHHTYHEASDQVAHLSKHPQDFQLGWICAGEMGEFLLGLGKNPWQYLYYPSVPGAQLCLEDVEAMADQLGLETLAKECAVQRMDDEVEGDQ